MSAAAAAVREDVPYRWTRVAFEEGALPSVESGGGCATNLRRMLAHRWPGFDYHDAANETQLRQVLRQLVAPGSTREKLRDKINRPMQARFDRVVQHAVDAELARLKTQFTIEVDRIVEQRIAPDLESERARARRMYDEANQEWQNLVARRDGIKQALTREELRLILNCLHPDRAPDDRRERYAAAFTAARRLQPYVDSFGE